MIHIKAQNKAESQLDLARQWMSKDDFIKAYTIAKEVANTHQNNVVLYAEAITVQGNALRRMKMYDKAESILKKVLNIRENKFGRKSLETSNALQNLAHVYLDSDLPNDALSLLEETLSIRLQYLSPQHEDVAKVHEALGTCHEQKQDYRAAIAYYRKAMQHPAYQTGDMYMNIANAYADIGDPAQAFTFLRKAESLIRQDSFDATSEKADLLNNLALCEKRFGNRTQAIRYLEDAIVIYETSVSSKKNLAAAYVNLGMLMHDEGLYKVAVEFLLKAIRLNKNDPTFSANVQLQLSSAHYENNDLAQSQQALEKGIKILRGLSQPQKLDVLVELYLNQVKVEMVNGDFKKARQSLNLANETLNLLPSSNQAYGLHLQYLSTYAELSKAECSSNSPLSILAVSNTLAAYDNAIHFLEKVMTQLLEKESVWSWQKQYDFLFDDAIELCLTQKQPIFIEKALRYNEQSKNVWLRHSQKFKAQRSQIPIDVQQKLSELSTQIAFLEKEYFLEKNKVSILFQTQKLLNIDKSLFDLKQKYAELIKQYPFFLNDKSKNDTLSLKKIQTHLSLDETVLLYHVSDKKVYLFIITKNAVSTHVVSKKENWLIDIRRFYELTSAPWQKPEQLDILCQLSFDFYKTLVQPAEPFFKNKKQLTIIPDDELALIPFEVFHDKRVTEKSVIWRYPFLLSKIAIQYRYQLSEFIALPKSINTSTKALIFSPYFVKGNPDLRPLYYNTIEGQQILNKIGGVCLEKDNASEFAFQALASQYPIIHLATHGITDMENPMLSRVAFTEQNDSIENEMLYVEEIYGMQLDNDLLVLSACQTNIGQILRGEGVLSVARAFKTVGVKSIITSLWSIDDKTTAYLMANFYDNLKQGMDKATALQKAKLDFIKEHPSEAHPFYWAALVSIGENTPLFKSSPFNWWIPLSILGTLILVFIIWKKKTAIAK